MTTAQMRRFPALRNPVMLAIVSSETISSIGTQMTFLALPWFVLTTTGSATKMGLVFAVELLPVALFGIPSGLLVQRLGVRRIMLATDLLRAPLVALVPVLHLAGLLSFPALLAVVFVIGACNAPYLAAQRLVVPETFRDHESMVVQGNAMIEAATRLAILIGPAVAGALIAAIGAVNVLWIDAGTFVVSYLILMTWLPRPEASPSATRPGHSGRLLDGARFVFANPLLRRVAAAALLIGLFFPALLASLPVLTHERYDADPRIAGLLFAAWGGGALLGTVAVMGLSSRVPPIRMGALSAIALALPLWFLALPLTPWQFAGLVFVSGIFTPMVSAPIITLILLRSPEQLRARVLTFVMTVNLLAGPAGYSMAGPALERLGVAPVLLVVAAGTTAAALLVLTLFGVREGETAPESAASSASADAASADAASAGGPR